MGDPCVRPTVSGGVTEGRGLEEGWRGVSLYVVPPVSFGVR